MDLLKNFGCEKDVDNYVDLAIKEQKLDSMLKSGKSTQEKIREYEEMKVFINKELSNSIKKIQSNFFLI